MDLYKYWETDPPVNESFACFVGWGKEATTPSAPLTQPNVPSSNRIVVDDANKLEMAMQQMAMLGGGVIERRKKKK